MLELVGIVCLMVIGKSGLCYDRWADDSVANASIGRDEGRSSRCQKSSGESCTWVTVPTVVPVHRRSIRMSFGHGTLSTITRATATQMADVDRRVHAPVSGVRGGPRDEGVTTVSCSSATSWTSSGHRRNSRTNLKGGQIIRGTV